MKTKRPLRLLLLALMIATLFALVLTQAALADEKEIWVGKQTATTSDARPDPLTVKQAALKEAAVQAKLNGKAPGKVHEVARGQYVELAREGEGAIWTVLGEFADLSHNQIAQPNRMVNNTMIWVPDFNRAYYMNTLFNDVPGANSMRNFYLEQSSNRFTVHGDVTDWVSVPGNARDYDDYVSPAAVWQFLVDSCNGWYDAQIAAGKTQAEIDAYLSQFDLRDGYDYDGDGIFNEPDGYIDTFQSVHAGIGNEAVIPLDPSDPAIWSHSWYAYFDQIGVQGPAFNPAGGFQIGGSNYWVGKYTIQPENGGLGVFAHEFGHDLGLPDLYDTAAMGASTNSTGYWSLMAGGSMMGDGIVDVASKSSHMGAWEKFQLGWLNYEVAYAGTKSEHRLGPMEYNTKRAQGLFVILPEKSAATNVGAPYGGAYYYYSGAGDSLNSFMSKSFSLAAGSNLTAKVKYSIELDWDYAYLVYSTDGGVNWTPIQTNLSSTTNPNGQNFGCGITGISNGWVDLIANLPAGNVLLGFRYWTDANTGGLGFMIDDINVTGFPTDGAETDAGWTYKPTTGFHVTTGTDTALYPHFYVAEYRTYKGYDATLRTGPYVFGYWDTPALSYLVDHFPYQDGLLINYWDTSQDNNETLLHPGEGLLLPVDAHYETLYNARGEPWDNRIQTYDSTFSLDPTDALPNLHWFGLSSPVPSHPAVKVFDDRTLYYDPTNPQGSVSNPNTGTQIRIQSISALGSFMQVEVRPAR